MKSKFKNKVVFWNDEHFINRKTRSPYWFVFDVNKLNTNRFIIKFIDIRGNQDKITVEKNHLYKKMEILDVVKLKHLPRSFIEGIFNG
ncbi:MAG: hypothetical protein ACOCRO_00860 [Halanaerobiales bacterium]